jgi:hypothetical protein
MLITADDVVAQWQRISALSRPQTEREVQRFLATQPFVNTYVLAMLEDDGPDASGFALQFAFLIDAVYRQALGPAPRRITEEVMETAASAAEKGIEDLSGLATELALRRFLYTRDFAEPELFAGVVQAMFDMLDDEPDLLPALGSLFLTIKGVALAYEHANGLATAAEVTGSLGSALEQMRGAPLPRVGRNDPCPCGSGRKFKKCCG